MHSYESPDAELQISPAAPAKFSLTVYLNVSIFRTVYTFLSAYDASFVHQNILNPHFLHLSDTQGQIYLQVTFVGV